MCKYVMDATGLSNLAKITNDAIDENPQFFDELDDTLDNQDKLDILQSLQDIEEGNYTTQAEMKKKLNL